MNVSKPVGFILLLLIALGPLAVLAVDQYQMDDNAIYHHHRAQMWMEVEKYGAAIREYQIAIRLKPASTMTAALYNDLGVAYLKTREVPKAIVSFQQAVKLNPNFSVYYDNLAKAYEQGNTMDTTAAQLRQTVEQNQGDPQAWFLLGTLYQKSGDEEAARHAFNMFIKLAPQSELADAARTNLKTLQSSQIKIK